MSARAGVLESGMGVDVRGRDATTAACRAVSDVMPHSSPPRLQEVRERGGTLRVDVTAGGPGADTFIACVAITVGVDQPAPR